MGWYELTISTVFKIWLPFLFNDSDCKSYYEQFRLLKVGDFGLWSPSHGSWSIITEGLKNLVSWQSNVILMSSRLTYMLTEFVAAQTAFGSQRIIKLRTIRRGRNDSIQCNTISVNVHSSHMSWWEATPIRGSMENEFMVMMDVNREGLFALQTC